MSRSKSEIYLHLVWATWKRQSLVTSDIERAVYRCIEQQAIGLKCNVLAIGGMPDHVHLAVRTPTYVDASKIVMQAKGVSSTMVRDQLCGVQLRSQPTRAHRGLHQPPERASRIGQTLA
jgi:REP element-mobilizing transposase RayT